MTNYYQYRHGRRQAIMKINTDNLRTINYNEYKVEYSYKWYWAIQGF